MKLIVPRSPLTGICLLINTTPDSSRNGVLRVYSTHVSLRGSILTLFLSLTEDLLHWGPVSEVETYFQKVHFLTSLTSVPLSRRTCFSKPLSFKILTFLTSYWRRLSTSYLLPVLYSDNSIRFTRTSKSWNMRSESSNLNQLIRCPPVLFLFYFRLLREKMIDKTFYRWFKTNRLMTH